MEYLQAVRMPAVQHFILDFEKRTKPVQIFHQTKKHFILYFKNKMFCVECSRLSYFTIMCNYDGYKMMGQDKSLVQLYNVQN